MDMKNVKMKSKPISEEERYDGTGDNYYQSFNFNNVLRNNNINDDVCIPTDLPFTSTNNICRVDYTQDFIDDEEMKRSQLLNLDAQTKREACILGLDYVDDDSSCNKSFFKSEIEMDSEMEMDSQDNDSWMNKRIQEWSKKDSINWYFNIAVKLGHSFNEMSDTLVMPGKELLKLSKKEFVKRDKLFGQRLYDSLHKLHRSTKLTPLFAKIKVDDEPSSSINYSDGESMNGSECPKKRPPGRPRILNPKVKEVRVKLWEFVRDMLLDPTYCPTLISWVNYDSKEFRFVKSDQVAKLWGKRKNNNNMTYEKFSRAMRYYYQKDIFQAVTGRRLVYKFGENATGWETNNPNFRAGTASNQKGEN